MIVFLDATVLFMHHSATHLHREKTRGQLQNAALTEFGNIYTCNNSVKARVGGTFQPYIAESVNR